jgi:hypothetical protein
VTAVAHLMVGGVGVDPDGADYALEPDAAVLVTSSGQAFIFDMTDRFYAVPPVAAAMLRQTLQRGEADAIADTVARYDVERDVARADLRRLLDDLRARGIVRRPGDRPRSPAHSAGATLTARLAQGGAAVVRSARGRAHVLLGLARLSFRLFGWSATLAAWRRRMPAHSGPLTARWTGLDGDVIDRAVRSAAASSPLGISCKERALAAWAMARWAGLPATLIVGVVQHPLGAHAWCESADADVLGDDAAICRRYLPVFRYA